jgi:GNAT superfamily N-acetyltransferase
LGWIGPEQTARLDGKRVMIEIRKAEACDIQDALAVHEAAFANHYATYHARPADAAKQAARLREGVRVVAIEGKTVVATAQYADHKNHVHVLGLAVHPRCQNRRIARQLLEWVAETALRLGHTTLVADTIEESGNVPVFEHLGFRAIERTVVDIFESDLHETLHSVKLERRLTKKPAGGDAPHCT